MTTTSVMGLVLVWLVCVPLLHVVCFLIAFSMQFGIEDLKALPDQTGCWDGVRNYQVVDLLMY